MDKDSSDVTIIVYDESLQDKSKTFDGHKDIFSCQSEIFKAILTGNTTVESSSGIFKSPTYLLKGWKCS